MPGEADCAGVIIEMPRPVIDHRLGEEPNELGRAAPTGFPHRDPAAAAGVAAPRTCRYSDGHRSNTYASSCATSSSTLGASSRLASSFGTVQVGRTRVRETRLPLPDNVHRKRTLRQGSLAPTRIDRCRGGSARQASCGGADELHAGFHALTASTVAKLATLTDREMKPTVGGGVPALGPRRTAVATALPRMPVPGKRSRSVTSTGWCPGLLRATHRPDPAHARRLRRAPRRDPPSTATVCRLLRRLVERSRRRT